MPWPKRANIDALKLQRENDGLRTTILCLRREIENKAGHVQRLKVLLCDRLTRIDGLTAQIDQLRLKNKQLLAAPATKALDQVLDLTHGHTTADQEHQQVLDENDALRAEIVQLKHKLDDYQQIRKEEASYIRGLWDDNRRLHSELERLAPCERTSIGAS